MILDTSEQVLEQGYSPTAECRKPLSSGHHESRSDRPL